ncbi:MAG: succinate dehydrogenase iron-sulfur subunit [Phycisphaeraceae bacterium]|nr:succinate dehydrogenase iron-sulfur subunit [Phycisphaeraceae bacterium]
MTAPANTKNIRFKIKRQDGPGKASYWQTFDVPYKPNLNVISCLQYIAEHPVTVAGEKSTPVVWDCNCLEEVCGACTMVINGKVRQSCSALLDELLKETPGGMVTLEPMTKFPVVRDLWVDRSRMFNALKTIQAWVPIDGTHDLGEGPKESAENQDVRYSLSRCMTCGCCLEACPQFLLGNQFIGAQAISQARYFNLHGTGKVLADQRLDAMMGPGGITDCGNAQNCVKVCPKEIPLTESIAAIGRQATVHAVKRFFNGPPRK